MRLVAGLMQGPFIDETAYKNACMTRLSLLFPASGHWFRLETEETEPGMPDTARFHKANPVKLIEYKVSDADGVIEFKRSQPLFYRQHRDDEFDMWILAWDRRFERSVLIHPNEVVAAKSRTLKLPDAVEAYECTVSVFDKELR